MNLKLVLLIISLVGVVLDAWVTYYLVRTGKGTEANFLGMKQLISWFGLGPALAYSHIALCIYLILKFAILPILVFKFIAALEIVVVLNNVHVYYKAMAKGQ